jgi:hypothetical protein
MRTLAFFLPLAATAFGCGSHVYYDLERDVDPQGCGETGSIVIAGTVDHVPVQIYDPFFSANFAPRAVGAAYGDPYYVAAAFIPETWFPCGAMAPSCPDAYGGSTPSAAALLNLPLGSGGTPTWLCDADHPIVTFTPLGSPGVQPLDVASTLTSLRKLGACPGAPVDASLSLSFDELTGTIHGTSFKSAVEMPLQYHLPEYYTGPVAWPFQGDGLIVFETASPEYQAGVVVMPTGSPDPGAVYCFAGPDYGWNNANLSVIPNLSRLGTCAEAAPVAGSLAVCAALGRDP